MNQFVNSAMNSPKQAMVTRPQEIYSASSQRDSPCVIEATSEGGGVILLSLFSCARYAGQVGRSVILACNGPHCGPIPESTVTVHLPEIIVMETELDTAFPFQPG